MVLSTLPPTAAPPSPAMSDNRLVELVSECIARLEDEGEAALDEVCAREPQHAAALRERIARLRASGMLEPATLAGGPPQRLGDFQLVRRIASGGMGVVYEARQVSMDRRVALKLVRPEMLYFPGARERFRREIEAVARLSHPGIAAIYVCGEEGELPYFAMEFVAGASLSDVLADLAGRTAATLTGADLFACVNSRAKPKLRERADAPLFEGDWTRACVRIVRDTCNVVEYAHAAGVLHRDLKPGNVLLTPEGRVVVVDFGLAALEGASTLTRSGAQLGSLPYMAPEQLRGDTARIGAPTDVYGLGVTLYELLALRRPFEGDSATSIERAIVEGGPRELRAANPSVSRDLETVVLCALDADPLRRYATPGEFAADLSRVLAGRPVSARRVGALGRAKRWVVRKPARAFALIGGPLLAIAALSGWWVSRRRAEDAQTAEQIALAQFEVTLGAVEVLASEGGEQPIARLLSLVEEAQKAYTTLESKIRGSHALAPERARLERLRADLLEQLGRRADSEQAYRQAAESAKQLMAAGEERALWRAQVADILSQLGGVLQRQARWQEAYEVFEEACAVAAPALEDTPHDELGRRAWAAAEINRAQLLRLLGEHEEARAGFQRALPEIRAQIAAAPADDHALDMCGMALAGAAYVEWRAGPIERALELWREALEVLERAQRLDPDEHRYVDDVGTTWSHYGRALLGAGQLELAEGALHKALAVLTELAERHPEFPDYRQRLVHTQDYLASLRKQQQRPEEALDFYRRAIAHAEELATRYPDSGTFLRDLPVALNNCAVLEFELGRLHDAHAHYRRATELYDSLGDEVSPQGALADAAIWAYVGHAETCLKLGDIAGAGRLLERAARLERPAPNVWRELAKLWCEVASAAPAARFGAERTALDCAFGALRKAVELGWSDAGELAESETWAGLRGRPEFAALLDAARGG
jgi:serine/threonine protein kinase/tetratricopeptide (TPR) repeat protein